MQKGEMRSPVMVLILSFITCGIYLLYWIYKVSDEAQSYSGTNTTSPAAELLLCMFTCGIYYIYWYYKYSKMIAECQRKAGITPEDNSVICIILAIFGLGSVSAMIIQSSLNKVWTNGNSF
ncbi:MAG: DUF4234 domain-containing protein [Bacillota bacterium]|nr:DUF4234 domain-containing protein [Bacillota bacterium]